MSTADTTLSAPDLLVIGGTSLLWGRADDPGPQVKMVTEDSITFFTDEYRNPLEVRVCEALA
jgi:hypothetical protein